MSRSILSVIALTATALSQSAIAADGWTHVPRNVMFPAAYGYQLTSRIQLALLPDGAFGGMPVTEFEKHGLLGKSASNPYDSKACFRTVDVLSGGERVDHFVLQTSIPSYVAKSLGLGAKPSTLVIDTRIESSGDDERAVSTYAIEDENGRSRRLPGKWKSGDTSIAGGVFSMVRELTRGLCAR